jgi:hypothetical protein
MGVSKVTVFWLTKRAKARIAVFLEERRIGRRPTPTASPRRTSP